MAIIKEYQNDNKLCKVTFTLPDEYFEESFKSASVVGEFNDWNSNKNKLERDKDSGAYSAEILLKSNKVYRFRYVVDDKTWLNDPDADEVELTPFGDSHNCILIL